MNCGTCKHSVEQPGTPVVFECRRYPPQVVHVMYSNVNGIATRFPRVEPHTSCGEYQRRDPGTDHA